MPGVGPYSTLKDSSRLDLTACYQYNNSTIIAIYRLKVTLMTTKKPTSFNPNFTITPAVASCLMRIEAVKQAIQTLPITPRVLANLRETARLFSTHYSTMIEGNRLTQEQVAQVIGGDQHFPGRERDQDEVKGYYAALDEVERLAKRREKVSEATVQKLHALVMGGGKTRVKSHTLSRRAKRDPRRELQANRLYAAGGEGCWVADGSTHCLDQPEG